jgi:hypothetical protein
MLEQTSLPVARRRGFLLTEAVLIVASILLAFTLDSWWDERKERVEETEILQGLQEEFLQNRATLNFRVALDAVDGILAELDASLGD